MIRRGKEHPDRSACGLPVMSVLSILFLIMVIFPVTDADAQTEKDTLRLLFYENSPFVYRSRSGEPAGIAVDIITPILEERGYSVEFEEIGGSCNCSSSLKDGSGDMLIGCNLLKGRNDNLTYSLEPLYSNWGVIYSYDGFEISTIFDLEDIFIGVVKDDIYFTGENGLRNLVESFGIRTNLVEFNNYNEVLESMEKGNVDAGLLNQALGNFIEDEWDIRRTSIVFSPVDIGIAVDGNNSDMVELLELIDSDLRTVKNDPDSNYYQTLDQYFAEENDKPGDPFIPSWLIRLLALLGLSVLLLAGITLFLRAQVRRRTRDLEITNKALNDDIDRRMKVERQLTQERNRSLFYLDLLIHDIGNIHHGLLSHIQLYELVSDDREKANRSVGQMKGLLDRSKVLVNNINKFTQAVSQEKKLRCLDITPIIKDSLASVMLANPNIDIRTSISIPKEGVHVDCEPLIGEMFHNLFHNAVKFHEGTHGKVEVIVQKTDDGKWYDIRISDHGRGIPDKMKKSIFDRLERSTERKHRGMGLAIVKVLVKRYNGKIDVYDRVPGDHTKGATLKVRLPVSRSNENDLEEECGKDPSDS